MVWVFQFNNYKKSVKSHHLSCWRL